MEEEKVVLYLGRSRKVHGGVGGQMNVVRRGGQMNVVRRGGQMNVVRRGQMNVVRRGGQMPIAGW
jgi:hypothetical protein